MKKFYSLLSALILISGISKAQLSLTQAANEPVVGDVDVRKDFDSTSAGPLPTSTGSAQVWNFTTLVSNTNAPVPSTYTVPSAVTGGSNYPTATVAQDNGTFFKSSTNLFEMVGLETTTVSLSFTNTAIIANWPMAYGYTNTDPIGGNVSSGFGNGTFTGTITTTAPGAGTLQLPNAITYTNCLMVKSRMDVFATIPVVGTATLVMTTYQYYHSSQKFPIVSIAYTDLQSAALNNSNAVITVNNNIFAGINEITFDNNYSVYPNPTSGSFHVKLDNTSSETVFVEIMNQLGQVVKKENLGNGSVDTAINISGMQSGVYFVKTSLGNKNSVKKLIVE